MNAIIRHIIKMRKTILVIFSLLIVFSLIAIGGTSTNYSMQDYLPEEASSTQGMKVMVDSLEQDIPNLSIMLKDLSINEVLNYKERIHAIEGVKEVTWLDDIVGIEEIRSVPIDFMDQELVENYYKDNHALLSVVVESGMEGVVVKELYDMIGSENAMVGDAVDQSISMSGASTEVASALLILLPILIIMLILATDSWIEPIFFLGTIGIAIIINMGSNIFFGEVSYITNTISPILQLAVSMDYAIFLLHSFTEKRKEYQPEEAMFHAMKSSIPTVGASALTTIIGFSALMSMQFGIGADLGLNLFKGIILSFISVMVFLPVVTLIFYKWIDKTSHRSFLAKPVKLSKVLMKVRIPVLVLALLLIVPSFLGQSQVAMTYGSVEQAGSRSDVDRLAIEEVFGSQQVLLIIYPQASSVKELAMVNELEQAEGVKKAIAYSNMVGLKVPENFVPKEALANFYKNGYGKVILYTDLDKEGQRSFRAVDEISNIVDKYYDDAYVVGQSAVLNDMRKVVSVDVARVNMIAILGILLILLITFRSISIPLILVFAIESAIWINLSIPYFQGTSINFIGYLILITIQLGATVDYAILLTHHYLEAREKMEAKDAVLHSITNNISAILISATILSSAGFVLAFTASSSAVAEIGMLIGRGTLLSFIMVVAVMPTLLVMFDKIIQKTTRRQTFYVRRLDQ